MISVSTTSPSQMSQDDVFSPSIHPIEDAAHEVASVVHHGDGCSAVRIGLWDLFHSFMSGANLNVTTLPATPKEVFVLP